MNIQLQSIDTIASNLLRAEAVADLLSNLGDEPPEALSLQMIGVELLERIRAARTEILAVDACRMEAMVKAKDAGED